MSIIFLIHKLYNSTTSFLAPISRKLGHTLNLVITLSNHYANDTYLYIFASKEELTTGIQTTEQCAYALYNWLSHNGLSLNPSKSKVIQFSVFQARYTKNVASINFTGSPVPLSPSIKSHGVTLDSHLTLDNHVTAVSKACYFHISALHHICKSILDNLANMIACSIVGFRLDYCNSLLAGMWKQI